MRLLTTIMLLAATTTTALAQQRGGGPAANSADVATPAALIAALYEVISGAAGQERDWNRFRSLFIPEAKLIPIGQPPDAPRARAFVMSVDDYITRSGPLLTERGFFEREIGNVTERFENIAHVFSTYDSRWTEDGEVFQRGINSIQLMWDGERWWVVNIMWRGVGPQTAIPAKYLKERE